MAIKDVEGKALSPKQAAQAVVRHALELVDMNVEESAREAGIAYDGMTEKEGALFNEQLSKIVVRALRACPSKDDAE